MVSANNPSDLDAQPRRWLMATSSSAPTGRVVLTFHSLRTVTSPEDQAAERKRYCGIVSAKEVLKISTESNVRNYLGIDDDGQRRKATSVNLAIRRTLRENKDLFPLLNAGVVVVAR